jgi:uncharacterized SAM-dependent methyltransferase
MTGEENPENILDFVAERTANMRAAVEILRKRADEAIEARDVDKLVEALNGAVKMTEMLLDPLTAAVAKNAAERAAEEGQK